MENLVAIFTITISLTSAGWEIQLKENECKDNDKSFHDPVKRERIMKDDIMKIKNRHHFNPGILSRYTYCYSDQIDNAKQMLKDHIAEMVIESKRKLEQLLKFI